MGNESASEDRRFLIAAVDTLPEYLLSNVLFWPIPGFPQPLTPGNLLFALQKVAFVQTADVNKQDELLRYQMDKLKQQYRVGWLKKVDHEFRSRLNQWKDIVLEAAHQDPNALSYSASARVRTLLTLLISENPDQPRDLLSMQESLDQRFLFITREGGFIWETRLETAFPKEKFWYLYRKFS